MALFLSRYDISGGFYHIDLNVEDIPKLGVVFPTEPGDEPLAVFPLVLSLDWKNSPPIFTTDTETITDLVNQRIHPLLQPKTNQLDDQADDVSPLDVVESADWSSSSRTTTTPVA